MLGSHEDDLKEIFLQEDKLMSRLEAIALNLQDTRHDTQDLKALAIEQRQATRNLWGGVILAVITALIGKFITVAK
jgi:hypothetical protein